MGQEIILALDAMGGDEAPDMVLKGANIARLRYPDLRFVLFGNESVIHPVLTRFKKLATVCTIEHTEETIKSDEKLSVVLRKRRKSSMSLAVDAVGRGDAHGVVSAGNTGALMAFAKIILRTLPGIDRPAMGSIFPTQRGESVMLDLGANIDCNSANLVQFAIMGEVFARNVLGVNEPTIGLLNIGSEEGKGNETIRNAAAALRQSGLPIQFDGFVEGDDIAAGTVDVVVTDGFAGNIALKTAEGTARLYGGYIRNAFKRSLMSRAGYLLARPALKMLRERLDPRTYNGAMFLGVNGVAVKSHGGTDHKGFASALSVAADMVSQGINPKIIAELSRIKIVEPLETNRAAV
ncbi:MAG: phosphate acyltransferase PlsX [Alphaproteobacteria bacterium]